MNEGGEVKEKSRFNEANLNILRLHNCWTNCARYRATAQYERWKWELDTAWSELCQDVTEKRMADHEKVEKEDKKLRGNIGKCNSKDAKSRNDLYEALNERQNFLRRLQDKAGKGGSYDDGTDEDFE